MISLVSLQHPITCNKGQSIMLPGNKRETSRPARLERNVEALGLFKKINQFLVYNYVIKISVNAFGHYLFHNVNNPVLNGLWKFQVDITKKLQLFKVQKIAIHLYFGSHVGWKKNAHQ